MTTTRKTSASASKQPKRDEDFAKPGETCDPTHGKGSKGKGKPDCPEGYPSEQPTEKPKDKPK